MNPVRNRKNGGASQVFEASKRRIVAQELDGGHGFIREWRFGSFPGPGFGYNAGFILARGKNAA
ncbi:hypothetical protein C7H09_08495 [Marinobacter fuscus]|uniref:Uncharacterized protein n=1 Tax=Marinobacter fuscus TaxID=2109942 RepID=A0A2T1KDR8_9GAMM|nr:hypothetical protein C7H09_08495 [Marinobacter fuscus]